MGLDRFGVTFALIDLGLAFNSVCSDILFDSLIAILLCYIYEVIKNQSLVLQRKSFNINQNFIWKKLIPKEQIERN